jgi:hypothetical protein
VLALRGTPLRVTWAHQDADAGNKVRKMVGLGSGPHARPHTLIRSLKGLRPARAPRPPFGNVGRHRNRNRNRNPLDRNSPSVLRPTKRCATSLARWPFGPAPPRSSAPLVGSIEYLSTARLGWKSLIRSRQLLPNIPPPPPVTQWYSSLMGTSPSLPCPSVDRRGLDQSLTRPGSTHGCPSDLTILFARPLPPAVWIPHSSLVQSIGHWDGFHLVDAVRYFPTFQCRPCIESGNGGIIVRG